MCGSAESMLPTGYSVYFIIFSPDIFTSVGLLQVCQQAESGGEAAGAGGHPWGQAWKWHDARVWGRT